MKNTLVKSVCACAVALATAAVGSAAAYAAEDSDITVVMIVKQSDPWFDDMTLGIEKLKEDLGINVYVQTPVSGDPSQQISIMENLISQKVDAICVVPNDPRALIPTIKKAREAGIKVVTHEAPDIADSVDLDVEAFRNEEIYHTAHLFCVNRFVCPEREAHAAETEFVFHIRKYICTHLFFLFEI